MQLNSKRHTIYIRRESAKYHCELVEMRIKVSSSESSFSSLFKWPSLSNEKYTSNQKNICKWTLYYSSQVGAFWPYIKVFSEFHIQRRSSAICCSHYLMLRWTFMRGFLPRRGNWKYMTCDWWLFCKYILRKYMMCAWWVFLPQRVNWKYMMWDWWSGAYNGRRETLAKHQIKK